MKNDVCEIVYLYRLLRFHYIFCVTFIPKYIKKSSNNFGLPWALFLLRRVWNLQEDKFLAALFLHRCGWNSHEIAFSRHEELDETENSPKSTSLEIVIFSVFVSLFISFIPDYMDL
jgi:hypothetical protein